MYKRVNIKTQERDQHSINQFPGRCDETSEETDETDERIFYGKPEDYAPWAVSIGEMVDGRYQHRCSGSIISSKIIVTAAHCTVTSSSNTFNRFCPSQLLLIFQIIISPERPPVSELEC